MTKKRLAELQAKAEKDKKIDEEEDGPKSAAAADVGNMDEY